MRLLPELGEVEDGGLAGGLASHTARKRIRGERGKDDIVSSARNQPALNLGEG
jgi:hypothetical protein